jgi:hypothetical protein
MNTDAYRKYVNSIEKTLQMVEDVKEWADFIKFLNALSKVILPEVEIHS